MSIFAILLLAAITAPLTARAAEGSENKKAVDAYVSIDTLTASVVALNGRHTVMTVQAGVDVPDAALRTRANQLTPRLRDAFDEELRSYAASLPAGSPPDPDYVARRLQAATDRILGKPGARFLIGGIMIN